MKQKNTFMQKEVQQALKAQKRAVFAAALLMATFIALRLKMIEPITALIGLAGSAFLCFLALFLSIRAFHSLWQDGGRGGMRAMRAMLIAATLLAMPLMVFFFHSFISYDSFSERRSAILFQNQNEFQISLERPIDDVYAMIFDVVEDKKGNIIKQQKNKKGAFIEIQFVAEESVLNIAYETKIILVKESNQSVNLKGTIKTHHQIYDWFLRRPFIHSLVNKLLIFDETRPVPENTV